MMTDASDKPSVDPRYTDGRYHAEVFSNDPQVQEVLSRRRAQKLQRFIDEKDSVFEFGVGTALNLARLKCASRAGYDPSPASAEICQAKGIEFVPSLAQLGARQFLVVLAHHVLEHVENPLQTLALLRPHVAPTGKLLLYVPYERGKGFVANEPNMHLFSWTPQTLGNLVTRAGFEVRQTGIAGYGYEQRLAPLAKFGWPVYAAAVRAAQTIRPCDEVILIAAPARS